MVPGVWEPVGSRPKKSKVSARIQRQEKTDAPMQAGRRGSLQPRLSVLLRSPIDGMRLKHSREGKVLYSVY